MFGLPPLELLAHPLLLDVDPDEVGLLAPHLRLQLLDEALDLGALLG